MCQFIQFFSTQLPEKLIMEAEDVTVLVYCQICGALCRWATLNEHMVTVHHRTLQCHMCGQSFQCFESLEHHILLSHSDLSYQCTMCGKVFPRLSYLRIHISDTGTEKYVCHICDRKEDSRLLAGPHSCHVCKKQFATFQGLRAHQGLKNHGPTKFIRMKCNVCDKKCTTISSQSEEDQEEKVKKDPCLCSDCTTAMTDAISVWNIYMSM